MAEELGHAQPRASAAQGDRAADASATPAALQHSVSAISAGTSWASRWLPEADGGERIAQLAIALLCWSVIGLSLWLQPAAEGLGTHEQLGFAPCGFYVQSGRPCPACGMTTSFALVVRGRMIAAVAAQPAGAVMAVMVALAAIVLPLTAWRGRSLRLLFARAYPKLWLAALGLLIALAWSYKISAESSL